MSSSIRIRKTRLLACAIAMSSSLLPALAWSHAYIDQREMPAGYSVDIDLRIPHGCQGAPTKSVRVKIPEGISSVYPENSRAWKVTTTKRKLPKPIASEGGVLITEVIDEITWTGNTVPDAYFESFVFRVKLPDTPGRTLFFKTIQTCDSGETRWIEVPTKPGRLGEFLRSVKEPAPFVHLIRAERPQLDLEWTVAP